MSAGPYGTPPSSCWAVAPDWWRAGGQADAAMRPGMLLRREGILGAPVETRQGNRLAGGFCSSVLGQWLARWEPEWAGRDWAEGARGAQYWG